MQRKIIESISFVWLCYLLCLTIFSVTESLTLGQIGSFFAGATAPIALLWFIAEFHTGLKEFKELKKHNHTQLIGNMTKELPVFRYKRQQEINTTQEVEGIQRWHLQAENQGGKASDFFTCTNDPGLNDINIAPTIVDNKEHINIYCSIEKNKSDRHITQDGKRIYYADLWLVFSDCFGNQFYYDLTIGLPNPGEWLFKDSPKSYTEGLYRIKNPLP